MITLDQFIDEYNGKSGIGDTQDNKGECVGLWEVWTDNLGEPHAWGNADDLMANAPRDAFDVIYNTATNYPSPGDGICMQSGWYGSPVGHVAIVVKADPSVVTVFEQNDRVGGGDGSCRLHSFDYTGVQGWIHPKVLDQSNQGEETMPVLDLARARVLSWGVLGRNGYDGTANALNGDADKDLNANHVGKDPYDEIWDFFNSPEGKDWIDNRLPAIYKTAANLKAEVIAQKSLIDSLRAQVNSLQVVPPVVVSPAPLADTNSDGLLKRLVEQITTWVKGTK